MFITPWFEPALNGGGNHDDFVALLFVPGYLFDGFGSQDSVDVFQGVFLGDFEELLFAYTFEEMGKHYLFGFIVGDKFEFVGGEYGGKKYHARYKRGIANDEADKFNEAVICGDGVVEVEKSNKFHLVNNGFSICFTHMQ